MSALRGSCLCGACTLSVEAGTEAGVCHCGMCRKWSGGMFIAVQAESAPQIADGAPVGVYRSSEWGERVFCRDCGSSLMWRSVDGSHYAVSVQIFDDPAAFPVTSEIFIDHKPASYSLAGTRPTMTEAEFMAQIAQQEG